MFLWQTEASSMAENRDPYWKKLQQTKEHIERPKSAHSKLSLEPQRTQEFVTNNGENYCWKTSFFYLVFILHPISLIKKGITYI